MQQSSDPAEWSDASFAPDIAAEIDGSEGLLIEALAEELVKGGQDPKAAVEALRAVLARVEGVFASDAADYRSISQRFTFLLNRSLIHIVSSDDPRHAAWQVAYAFGAPCCDGVSMVERGISLGHEGAAALSKGAKGFQRGCGLPPSEYMKTAESAKGYAEARERQLSQTHEER